MLVYHFLPAEYALDDIKKRRIKVSEIDTLNDPFELWCSALDDPHTRTVLRVWKTEMARHYGMLCFCPTWTNPVLWSHYANSHRGMCLGFECDERFVKAITYVRHRVALKLPQGAVVPQGEEPIKQLLYTKYADWSYEQEYRAWVRLTDADSTSGLYFYEFGDVLCLREVIAGPLCTFSRSVIDSALEGQNGVEVIKARLAFRSFQIVRNRRGFTDERSAGASGR